MTPRHRHPTGAERASHARRRELTAAAIAALLVALILLVAFARTLIPDGSQELRVDFASGNQLKKGSVVRVAGLDIGTVRAVEATPEGHAIVTMDLDSDAPELRRDATFAIRPRLAFEGNFFVEVSPGSRGAPRLDMDAVVPRERTSTPVQLDQVLSVFDAPVREGAAGTISELARGLGSGTMSALPAGAASGAEGLRGAVDELDRTLDVLGTSARALRGTNEGDLTRALDGTAELAEGFGRDPKALADLVTNFNRTAAALSVDGQALQRAVSTSADLVREAPAALRRIDAALPEVRSFARATTPALKAIPPAARAGSGALRQIHAISSPDELPLLARRLAGPVRTLVGLQEQLDFALPYTRDVGQCLVNTIVPALKKEVPDGKLSANEPLYLEAAHTAASLASVSMSFDANGSTYRAGLGQSEGVVKGVLPNGKEVVGFLGNGVTGVRPAWRGSTYLTPKRPDQPCKEQPVVDYTEEIGPAFAGWKRMAAPKQSRSGLLRGLRELRQSLLPKTTSRRKRTSKPLRLLRRPQAPSGPQSPRPAPPVPSRSLVPNVLDAVPGAVQELLDGLKGGSSKQRPQTLSDVVGGLMKGGTR